MNSKSLNAAMRCARTQQPGRLASVRAEHAHLIASRKAHAAKLLQPLIELDLLPGGWQNIA